MHGIGRSQVTHATICAVGLVSAMSSAGCSVIGLASGGVADAGKPDRQRVRPGEVEQFNPGDSLVLELRSGERVAGRYVEPARLRPDQYRHTYESWLQSRSDRAPLPAIGNDVRFGAQRGIASFRDGEFMGFAHEGVEVKRGTATEVVPYGKIREMNFDGGSVTGHDLVGLRTLGGLPVVTRLVMETPDGWITVALDDVKMVDHKTPKGSLKKGFVTGLVVDAWILFALAAVAASYTGPFGR